MNWFTQPDSFCCFFLLDRIHIMYQLSSCNINTQVYPARFKLLASGCTTSNSARIYTTPSVAKTHAMAADSWATRRLASPASFKVLIVTLTNLRPGSSEVALGFASHHCTPLQAHSLISSVECHPDRITGQFVTDSLPISRWQSKGNCQTDGCFYFCYDRTYLSFLLYDPPPSSFFFLFFLADCLVSPLMDCSHL